MEESPLLLSRPGMGVRLTTYYRKGSPLDASHQRLVQGAQGLRAPTRALSAPRSVFTCCFGQGLGCQPASVSLSRRIFQSAQIGVFQYGAVLGTRHQNCPSL